MSGYPEPLEYIFQRVERDSERRAREELVRNELTGELPELFQTVDPSATYKAKQRQRGSISITQVGQLPDVRPLTAQGHKHFSTIAEEAPFYQARITNDSVETLSSYGDVHQDRENDHTTQVQITGPQSLSRAMQAFLPRQLTRSRSINVVASMDTNVVIDVSVEKAIIESTKDDELNRASVHLGRSLRKQASTVSMSASSPARKGWVAKAKGITRRFRRTKHPSQPLNLVPP